MKTVKYCFFIILFLLVANILPAQQSEFQGTWVGERDQWVDRSAYRLEITGNRWQEFYNNRLERAGTARFSAGRAELLLADGRLARDLRLLAPGIIEQPISMFDGYYRFNRVQPSSTQPNTQNTPENRPSFTLINRTGYTIRALYIIDSSSTSDSFGSNILNGNLSNGQSTTVRLSQPLNVVSRYDIRIVDTDGDTYTKWNVLISNNGTVIFTFDDFD